MTWSTWSRSVTSSRARLGATTSCPWRAATRSWPSWPPPPVIRIRMCSPGLQRLPPPPVLPVPLDRRRQRLVEVVGRGPSQTTHLGDVERVAPVVPEPVGDVLDHRVVLPQQSEDLLGEDAVGDLVADADVVY